MNTKFKQSRHAAFGAVFLLMMLSFGCGENIDNPENIENIDNNNGNNITEPSLMSIAVTPADAVILEENEQQYAAIGRYSDNTEKDITAVVTWNSADEAVAAITSAGLAKAALPVKSGTVRISATLQGIMGRVSLTVIDLAAPESITITPACSAISSGNEQQFTVIGRYAGNLEKDVTSKVSWHSSDETVATITASGLAMSSPTTTGAIDITAALGGAEARAELTVSGNELPQSISITPVDPSIPYGTSIQFKAEGTFSDGSRQDMTSMVKWLSSDATVTFNKSPGRAKSTEAGAKASQISAAFACVDGKSTLSVRNADLSSIAIEPSPYSFMSIYGSKQFKAIGTFSDSSTWDMTRQVAWSSSDTAVASIDVNGFAASPNPGGVFGDTVISAVSMPPLSSSAGQTLLGVGLFEESCP